MLVSLLALAHAGEIVDEPPPKVGFDKAMMAAVLQNDVLRPWGQLQVFTTLWDQDADVQADPAGYGDPEADPGFQLARARFGFTGDLPLPATSDFNVDYGLSMGISTPYDALRIGSSGVSMVDGFLRVSNDNKLGPSSIALGLVKVPFSRESLMASQDLVFQERSVGPENLTSVRDVGVLGSQALRFGQDDDAPAIVFSGGAFNGNADPLGDFDPGLMYGGRLEFQKGETYRTWDPDGGVAIGAGVAGLLNTELATRTSAISGDLFLRIGPWSLVGEFGRSAIHPTDVTLGAPSVLTDTTRLSWTAQTSFWIGIKDEHGVELAIRASAFDDNQRLKDNGDVLVFHGGAIWRSPFPQFDIGAGYIHRQELGGVALPNDTIRIWTQVRPRFSKQKAR